MATRPPILAEAMVAEVVGADRLLVLPDSTLTKIIVALLQAGEEERRARRSLLY
jgi:hypothetical protein